MTPENAVRARPGLAILAGFTAWYARNAFVKQSKQASDQTEMLKLQRRQADEQRKINNFVGRQHAKTLAALRELVKRLQTKSSLTRIPLPDADEQREMVISAFVSQTDDKLRKLSTERAILCHSVGCPLATRV